MSNDVAYVAFSSLFEVPLRNGVNYPTSTRGHGVRMVNMGEAFLYDRIEDQDCERVPLTKAERQKYILEEGDLLFVRQSLKYEGAGRCVYVGSSGEMRTWEGHLIRVRLAKEIADSRYYYYYFRSPAGRRLIESIIEQVSAAGIRGSDLSGLMVPCPDFAEQARISDVLWALDDKISANSQVVQTCRLLGGCLFSQALEGGSVEQEINSISSTTFRGVTPKYSNDTSDLIVLNQRCVRDGRVSLAPARRTVASRVPQEKVLQRGDVLVNSTGVGTLGRVARWAGNVQCTVDSHVTIVRFDEEKVDPLCGAFAMLAAQPEIERLGEGSTGQTELSRTKLGSFRLMVPNSDRCSALRPELDALERRSDSAIAESAQLATLRDTLLPRLISGELRLKDAEKVVEDAT